MAKIGIYGGSFNPVHNGHVLAAQEFVRNFSLDTLLVIPAGVPPHKALTDKSPGGKIRAELLRIAMTDVPNAVVDEIELFREGKSYSYDTIIQLKKRYPHDDMYLLMGTDMLLSFDKWYRYEDIIKLVKLGVINRYDTTEKDMKAMNQMKLFLEQKGGQVSILSDCFVDVSSTTARRMLLLGCGEAYVSSAVLKELHRQGLYGAGCNLKNLPFESLKEVALSLHDEKRIPHAIGCSEIAIDLAKHYGANEEDAARAGILHDITKALGPREQLRLCEKYAIMTDEYGGEQTKLLHGKTAAAAAKHIFGENDAVCSAVSWHTTGRAGMNLLEKIIYIADYIEPNRDFDGVEKLRSLAYADIDAAVLLGIQMTIGLLMQNNRPLNRHSVEARDYLLQEGKL